MPDLLCLHQVAILMQYSVIFVWPPGQFLLHIKVVDILSTNIMSQEKLVSCSRFWPTADDMAYIFHTSMDTVKIFYHNGEI